MAARLDHARPRARLARWDSEPALSKSRFDPDLLFRALLANDVEFVVIGGIARVFRGSAHPTMDADIIVKRDRYNPDGLRRRSMRSG